MVFGLFSCYYVKVVLRFVFWCLVCCVWWYVLYEGLFFFRLFGGGVIVAYPTDVLNGKIDDVYVSAGNAQSDLAGVVAGADVLASQFVDVKNTMQYLQSLMNELKSNYWYVPVGLVSPFAGAYSERPPQGWLFCDGATLNSSSSPQYANLFSVIGSTYGGTGASSFKVPDLRGRVPLGQSSSVSPNAAAGYALSARAHGSLYGAESLPAHAHSGSYSGSMTGQNTLTGSASVSGTVSIGFKRVASPGSGSNAIHWSYPAAEWGSNYSSYGVSSSGSASTSGNVSVSGSVSGTSGTGDSGTGSGSASGTHGVVQPSLAMSFIIKY